MIKKVFLALDEKEFKLLENLKEEAKLFKRAENWEDYILKLAGVRK